jgi:myo-inositol 2-dehydrogenase/D-chiro-inositol 1-dehydrogenase
VRIGWTRTETRFLEDEAKMSKLRIALIGFGRFGQCHAQAIATSRCAQLVGVAARTEESCRKARDQFGVPTTSDYRELVTRDDVHAVDIVLPADLHEPVALAALRAGKHVLLEKPMALTTRQCDRILAEASKRGLTLCIDFELRASPLWSRIKRDIEKGVVGQPLYGSYDLWRFPFRQGSESWRYMPARVGSWVHEEPVHYLDLAVWLFETLGAPAQLTSHIVGRGRAPVEMSDNMTFLLRWPQGQYFHVTQTNSFFGYQQQVRVAGEDGSIVAIWEGAVEGVEEPRQDYFIVTDGTPRRVKVAEKSNEPLDLKRNIEAFCQRVSGCRGDIATGEEGRRAVALVETALRSARTGRPVRLRTRDEG